MVKASEVTVGRFPKLATGESCDGAPVLRDGVEIGCIRRLVSWRFKSATSRALVAVVLGYEVEIGETSREFRASGSVELSEALAAARAFATA